MVFSRCPGQDNRFWKAEDVLEESCPYCGEGIEFWKDESRHRCVQCGEIVRNPHFDMGCAKWCQFAKQCLGLAGAQAKDMNLYSVLIAKMMGIFGSDQRRIRHALRVLDFAEEILDRETADPLIVKASAILHDIGIHEAEKKYGSAAGKYQQIEGRPIARKILQSAGVDTERIEHICAIIADHHSASTMDSPEFRVIWDADHLVNEFVEATENPSKDIERLVCQIFKTRAGQELAYRQLGRHKQSQPGETG